MATAWLRQERALEPSAQARPTISPGAASVSPWCSHRRERGHDIRGPRRDRHRIGNQTTHYASSEASSASPFSRPFSTGRRVQLAGHVRRGLQISALDRCRIFCGRDPLALSIKRATAPKPEPAAVPSAPGQASANGGWPARGLRLKSKAPPLWHVIPGSSNGRYMTSPAIGAFEEQFAPRLDLLEAEGKALSLPNGRWSCSAACRQAGAVALPVGACLAAVAADPHRAPSAQAIAGGVVEHPSAVRCGAHLQPLPAAICCRGRRAGCQAGQRGSDSAACYRGKVRRAVGIDLDPQAQSGQGLVGAGQPVPAWACLAARAPRSAPRSACASRRSASLASVPAWISPRPASQPASAAPSSSKNRFAAGTTR